MEHKYTVTCCGGEWGVTAHSPAAAAEKFARGPHCPSAEAEAEVEVWVSGGGETWRYSVVPTLRADVIMATGFVATAWGRRSSGERVDHMMADGAETLAARHGWDAEYERTVWRMARKFVARKRELMRRGECVYAYAGWSTGMDALMYPARYRGDKSCPKAERETRALTELGAVIGGKVGGKGVGAYYYAYRASIAGWYPLLEGIVLQGRRVCSITYQSTERTGRTNAIAGDALTGSCVLATRRRKNPGGLFIRSVAEGFFGTPDFSGCRSNTDKWQMVCAHAVKACAEFGEMGNDIDRLRAMVEWGEREFGVARPKGASPSRE